MNWDTLKNLPAWYPLSSMTPEYKVEDNLYKVGNEQYILTVSHNQRLEPTPPCITIVMWATTDGIARRIVNQKIEENEDDNRIYQPPSEMLLHKGVYTYREIIYNLKDTNDFSERHSYRMSDGAFIYREIQTPTYSFFFRGFEEDDNEILCAIQYRLLQK